MFIDFDRVSELSVCYALLQQVGDQPFEICLLQLKNNLPTIFLSGFLKKSHKEWQSSKQAV